MSRVVAWIYYPHLRMLLYKLHLSVWLQIIHLLYHDVFHLCFLWCCKYWLQVKEWAEMIDTWLSGRDGRWVAAHWSCWVSATLLRRIDREKFDVGRPGILVKRSVSTSVVLCFRDGNSQNIFTIITAKESVFLSWGVYRILKRSKYKGCMLLSRLVTGFSRPLAQEIFRSHWADQEDPHPLVWSPFCLAPILKLRQEVIGHEQIGTWVLCQLYRWVLRSIVEHCSIADVSTCFFWCLKEVAILHLMVFRLVQIQVLKSLPPCIRMGQNA